MRFYQLDSDTKKYVKRLNYNGVKTPTDIYSVDQFIRGLKDSGLWANCLDIWFLRSEQNRGSGNIVYPFRNDSSKITLINSPTWTSNGIYFNGTNQYGTLNNPQKGLAIRELSIATCFLCHDITATRRPIFSSELGGSSRGPFIVANVSPKAGTIAGALYSEFTSDGTNSTASVNGTTSGITRSFQTTVTFFSPNSHNFIINGGNANTNSSISSIWNNNDLFYIGTRNAGDGFLLGTITFLAWWTSSLSTENAKNLHTLIKNTIGKGLALP
jgi:hypothetical protein